MTKTDVYGVLLTVRPTVKMKRLSVFLKRDDRSLSCHNGFTTTVSCRYLVGPAK